MPSVWVEDRSVRDVLNALQSWFMAHCDDDWEHQYGIKIETLDNPGWAVEIDLAGTELSAELLPQIIEERSTTDWIRCSASDGSFKGFGGPRNLVEILDRFLAWAEAAS